MSTEEQDRLADIREKPALICWKSSDGGYLCDRSRGHRGECSWGWLPTIASLVGERAALRAERDLAIQKAEDLQGSVYRLETACEVLKGTTYGLDVREECDRLQRENERLHAALENQEQ